MRTPYSTLLLLVMAAGLVGIGRAALPLSPVASKDESPGEGAREPERTDALGDPLPPGALVRLGSIRLRHGLSLRSVAFSPNGKFLASGGRDEVVRLWEATTGKELRQFPGLKKGVSGIAFSPDGKLLAGAGADQVVCLWDVETGKEVRRLEGHRGAVHAIAFAPKGDRLVSGDDAALRLWDVGSGKSLRVTEIKEGGVHAVAFSPDGRTVAGGGGDKTARLWEVDSGKLLHELKGHGAGIHTVVFSFDGTTLVTVGDNDMLLFDTASGNSSPPLAGLKGRFSSVVFSLNGKVLAIVSGDRMISLWDWAERKELRKLSGHSYMVRALAFSPDGKKMVTAGGDTALTICDVLTGESVLHLPGHQERLTSVVYSSDGRMIATAAWDGTVRLWDAKTGQEQRRLNAQIEKEKYDPRDPKYLTHLAFAPDGKHLAVVCGNETVLIWEVATGKVTQRYQAGSVAFSPDGKLIACGERGMDQADSNMGIIRLYDRQTGKEVRVLRGHLTTIHTLIFSADGKTLISCGHVLLGFSTGEPGESETKFVRFWDVASGKERVPFPPGELSNKVSLSPDGRTLVTTAMRGKSIALTELVSGKRRAELAAGHSEMVFDIAFSPDGRTLASASMDGTIRLFDLPAGEEIGRLEGHRGWVLSVAFSPDGKTLVSGGIDTTALLWDVTRFTRKRATTQELAPKELEKLWDDLAGEAGGAYQSIGKLTAAPKQAMPFLSGRVQPVAVPEAARLARLLTVLDSDDFEAREKAQAELENLGPLAAATLRRALAGKPSAEARRRLEMILDKCETATHSAAVLRAFRAIEVLEYIGTEEARRRIAEIASGAAESPVTQAAQAAKGRLKP